MSDGNVQFSTFWGLPEQWKADNPDCFLCGRAASRREGSFLYCDRHVEGPVRWCKYNLRVPAPTTQTFYDNSYVKFVDFTDPAALSSPA
jgi:hypothetical protein